MPISSQKKQQVQLNNSIPYLINIVECFIACENKGIFWVFWQNIKQTTQYYLATFINVFLPILPKSRLKKKLEQHCNRVALTYYFYSFMYKIMHNNLIINQDLVEINQLLHQEGSAQLKIVKLYQSLRCLLKNIATDHTSEYNYLVALYVKMVKAMLPLCHTDKKNKVKKQSASLIDYVAKQNNSDRKLLRYTSLSILLLTSISSGFLPAVLASQVCGGLLLSIVLVGLPSIIVHLIIYANPVDSFISELHNGDLFRDKQKKFRLRFIPLIMTALAAGIVYAAMAFVTSTLVIDTLLAYILPQSLLLLDIVKYYVSLIAISSAICISVATLITTLSLYFSSLKDFVTDHLAQKNQVLDHTNQQSIFLKLRNQCGLFAYNAILLCSASYLSYIETALLYSMSIILIPNPAITLSLVLLTAPANLLFTFKIFDFMVNLGSKASNYRAYFSSALVNDYSNPIARYEDCKFRIKIFGLGALIVHYAISSGRGLRDEMSDMKNFFGTSFFMRNRFAPLMTQATETLDAAGACLEGVAETYDAEFKSIVPAPGTCLEGVSETYDAEFKSIVPASGTQSVEIEYSHDLSTLVPIPIEKQSDKLSTSLQHQLQSSVYDSQKARTQAVGVPIRHISAAKPASVVNEAHSTIRQHSHPVAIF